MTKTSSAAILELELISGSPLLVNSEIRELSRNSDKIFKSTTPLFQFKQLTVHFRYRVMVWTPSSKP